MPNLLDLRRRIRSVKSTQQITRAMKMVSAAKLRRAQERAIAGRPYAERLRSLLQVIAAQVARDAAGSSGTRLSEFAAGLLAQRPENRILLVAISSDTGLAGPFNANVVKAVLAFVGERPGREITLLPLGRKVRDFFRRRSFSMMEHDGGLFGRTVQYSTAQKLAALAAQQFAAGEIDAVYIVGNEFKNVIQQRVAVHRILPVDMSAASGQAGTAAQAEDYLFEEPPQRLLDSLLPRYIQVQFYRALLESSAAEHAARMNAMETATSNAADMIDSLTLNMNRVRQATITKEIIEIVSGAAALEG